MALVTPLLVIILAAAAETGYYFYEQHRLTESVRDAARYAGRQALVEYAACTGSPSATIQDNTKLVAQKGTLDSGDPDLLWGWGETGEAFTVTMTCASNLTYNSNSVNLSGIYSGNPGGAPVVTVDASIPHRSVFAVLGLPLSLTLNAQQQSAVMGV